MWLDLHNFKTVSSNIRERLEISAKKAIIDYFLLKISSFIRLWSNKQKIFVKKFCNNA
ncbi:hypothetical protein PGB90_004225 [Kerria lacca]